MAKRWTTLAFACVLVVAMALVVSAQPVGGTLRILVVDQTKTFGSTMRVAGLVGALRQVPIFEVGVTLSDVAGEWDDPLTGQTNQDAPYDIAIVLPRTIDTGTAHAIWLISNGLGVLRTDVRAAIGIVSEIATQVFSGLAEPKTVDDDLFPAILWGIYAKSGWMR